ncbi:sensor histidine kinase [Gordonia caeni]|uniref:histidine kinase n=1 Tax=Gordonia caeni TaxID=1007097 RepID=A0ABP7NZC9_9ACTN
MKIREGLAAARRDLLTVDRVSDPQLRAYLGNRWNWLAMLAAVIMTAITWPVLADTLDVPAYVLPVLAVASTLPLLGIAAGGRAVRVGWVLIILASLATVPLPHAPGHADLRVAVPQFLILIAMTLAALCTQRLRQLPEIWLVTALTLLVCLQRDIAVGWIFGLTVITIGIAFVRYWARSRREIAEQTEQTELALAREEVLAERSRIARELHDVVAHRMSMVVVQAQTARYRLAAADPSEEVSPAVAGEFEAIAAAARESLDEVRSLLGVLRTQDIGLPGGADAPLDPAPGIDDLAGLVDSVRAVGVDLELDDRLDHDRLGAATGLVVYRIVQEALSNAARHAPEAQVRVTLEPDTATGAVHVAVVNRAPTGGPAGAGTDGEGLGIRGMTERAAALGGSLQAAPTTDGGFAVTAVLPAAEHAEPPGRTETDDHPERPDDPGDQGPGDPGARQ